MWGEQPVDDADFIIPIKIEDTTHKVYVIKRPGVDEFMVRMAEKYEIVIFTASLSLVSKPADDHSCTCLRILTLGPDPFFSSSMPTPFSISSISTTPSAIGFSGNHVHTIR